MTVALSGKDIGPQIEEALPGSVVEATTGYVMVKTEHLLAVAGLLKDRESFGFDYLNFVTAVDYYDYFEAVYQLTSTSHNHSVMIKARCHHRQDPVLPSVVGLWQGADFQEREVYDLMGIYFEGHPNMKRIFLWEGFEGHPLRKDYL